MIFCKREAWGTMFLQGKKNYEYSFLGWNTLCSALVEKCFSSLLCILSQKYTKKIYTTSLHIRS